MTCCNAQAAYREPLQKPATSHSRLAPTAHARYRDQALGVLNEGQGKPQDGQSLRKKQALDIRPSQPPGNCGAYLAYKPSWPLMQPLKCCCEPSFSGPNTPTGTIRFRFCKLQCHVQRFQERVD